MEQSLERQEHSPRNLITHEHETLDALTQIEGIAWRDLQGVEKMDSHPNTVANALAKIMSMNMRERVEQGSVFFIDGATAGTDRWGVYADGRVVLMRETATPRALEMAPQLGFEIE